MNTEHHERPLHVLQIALSLVIGGTEKLVYDIVRQVDQTRVTPVVCCLDEIGPLGQELQRDGYPLYVLNRQPGIDWRVVRQLRHIIRQEQIDVIHAHQYTPYFYGLMAVLPAKLTMSRQAPKLLFTEHGRFYPDQRKLKRVIMNPVLSVFTDEIVTISRSTKQSLITYENFPRHRIKVVYNGIELGRFSEPYDASAKKAASGVSQGDHIIGIVARLDSIKNHAMLLRAFQRVLQHQPKTSLIIVGEGPEETRLKPLAESLDLQGKAIFLGARRDVHELLHMFDIFALSSFSEGTSVTLIEAMAAGLPIVATNVGGNPEVIQDRETGFLVQNDDEQAMADMLVKLLADPSLRQQMGQAGRQRAYAMFSLDNMIREYVKLYEKMSGRI